jgi:hypothetical protein
LVSLAHAKIGDPLEHAIAKEASNTKGKEGDLERLKKVYCIIKFL